MIFYFYTLCWLSGNFIINERNIKQIELINMNLFKKEPDVNILKIFFKGFISILNLKKIILLNLYFKKFL